MKKGIISIISLIIGSLLGFIGGNYLFNKNITEKTKKVDKFKSYYGMLNEWLSIRNEGRTLEEYFLYHGYKTIAIYGMGEMGKRLYEELLNTSIKIKYAIDRNVANEYSEIDIVTMEDELMKVDIIVVTATFDYDKIESKINELVDYPVVSLEDVVYNM